MRGEVGEEEFGEVLEGDAVVARHLLVEAVGEFQEAGEGGGGAVWFAGVALTPALPPSTGGGRKIGRGGKWRRGPEEGQRVAEVAAVSEEIPVAAESPHALHGGELQ